MTRHYFPIKSTLCIDAVDFREVCVELAFYDLVEDVRFAVPRPEVY